MEHTPAAEPALAPAPTPDALIQAVDTSLKEALLGYSTVLPVSMVAMGKRVLSAPGKVMSAAHEISQGRTPAHPARWPLYVLLSCQAAAPSEPGGWRKALPAAVAVEISMAAADLLDEITDGDPSDFVQEYGTDHAINTCCLMIVMAQQVLLRRSTDGSEDSAACLAACSALQDMLAQAATGQHLDLLYDDMDPAAVDLEMSLEMTSLKAGALIGGACRMGALMSGTEPEVVEALAAFGKEIGSVYQLINDIQDVTPGPGPSEAGGEPVPERKTDLRLRKRTIPIVFALREDAAEPNAVQAAFANPQASYDEEALRRAVVASGGVHFAGLIAEVHRQRSLEALNALEALRPGARSIMMPLVAEPFGHETDE